MEWRARGMNLRVLAAAVYLIMFAVTLLNMAALPSSRMADVAPTLFTSIIMALVGTLLSLWVYQDGETIKTLRDAIAKLETQVEELRRTK